MQTAKGSVKVAGPYLPPDASSAVKAAAASTHVAELKKLIAEAEWPGRTRQSIVDEATAEEAAFSSQA